MNIGMSMLWFWIAYIIVTVIGILYTIFNIVVLHMKSMKGLYVFIGGNYGNV